MDKGLRLLILTVTGVIFLSAFYYFVIYQPSLETEAMRQQTRIGEAERIKRERTLKECLDSTFRAYLKKWDRRCKRLGKNPGCALPSHAAHSLDIIYQDDRKDCFKLYRRNI